MSNILESLKDYLNPELLEEAARAYGENETGIFKAISSLAPTILAGLLEKCGDSHAIDHIFSTLRNYNPDILDRPGSLIGAKNDRKEDSGQIIDLLFGAKLPAIANAVASFSGVKQTTVFSLLDLAGPLVMALLSKKINAEKLTASTLVSYLLSERSQMVSLLPAGVGSLLGMANAGLGYSNEAKSIGGIGWFWPLMLLVAFGMVIAVLLKNCSPG